MRARAPGKVVLSGAYAVLEGAPAIVAAVDRFVVADSERTPELVTPEVRAAIGEVAAAPWFDASALREGGKKLGLGSSAAIVVASLGALELEQAPELSAAELAAAVYPRALAAHRQAQGGGSGVDVAASAYGGVLAARRVAGSLECTPLALPAGLHFVVLAEPEPASTPELVRRVLELRTRDGARYTALMGRQTEAAEAALAAARAGDASALLDALAEQCRALAALGSAAGVPIVTREVEALAREAERCGAAALPAGAGGGDLALWVSASGVAAPEVGLRPLALELGAPGVERVP